MTMLKLADDSGRSFELELVGFEAPGHRWFDVRMRVNDGTGVRIYDDPCLTPKDVRDLVKWLRKVGSGLQSRPSIGFREPTLTLNATTMHGSEVNLQVRVYMGSDDQAVVTLRQSLHQLLEASNRLQERLVFLED